MPLPCGIRGFPFLLRPPRVTPATTAPPPKRHPQERTTVMATTAPVAPAPVADDLGLDREFLLKMASWPIIAVGFTFAAWLGHAINPFVPVALLCLGMIVAAVIDGWAFKVPNWLTLPLVLSGWGIGL